MIKYSFSSLKCKGSKKLGKNVRKYYYVLVVRNQESLRKLVPLLNGKVYIKQPQLSLLDEYLSIRYKESGPYSVRCHEIVDKIQGLNKWL